MRCSRWCSANEGEFASPDGATKRQAGVVSLGISVFSGRPV